MNLDELTPDQREAVDAVLRTAPADDTLDAQKPSQRALRAAYSLAGEELAQRDLRRVANGLTRAGLVAA